jgi:Ca2+-binding RTX toxin-like protein
VKHRLSHLGVVLAAASAALVQVQPASAGTAQIREARAFGLAIAYVAGAGETNTVTTTPLAMGAGLEIQDTGATVIAGVGCVSVTPQRAQCEWPDRSDAVLDIELGDMGDSFTQGPTVELSVSFLDGGDGDDRIVAGDSLGDFLIGGPGDDTLMGGVGHDSLDGGPGADLMSGGSSSFHHGGVNNRHFDTVSYADRINPVQADADGVADDGEAGEGDNIRVDIEEITGGRGDDILTSGFRAHYLSGGRGNDILVGNAGRDSLRGWAGNDILSGGDGSDYLEGDGGDDVLRGGRFADTLAGGNGNDGLFGGLGADRMEGNDGADLLVSRDGLPDVVAGGFGFDRGRIDRLDAVRGIERFLR